MTISLKLAVLALVLGLATSASAEDAHHPPGAPPTQATPAPAQPMRPGMGPGGTGMMGMMGQDAMMGGDMMGESAMPAMMRMMGMMRMIRGGEHIEGRLAFIKAELKITEAQEKAWNDFANALRQATSTVHEARPPMSTMSGAGNTMTPPQLAEQYEKQLAARLEAARGMKVALGPFYAVLTDQQKQIFARLYPMFVGTM